MTSRYEKAILAELQPLRGFARHLCHGASWSEDLLQETLIIALRLENDFTPGTNLKAWLFALMKNAYRNENRKNRAREKILVCEEFGETARSIAGNQEGNLALRETLVAISKMPAIYREVLLMVTVYGLNYNEAAIALNVPVGTVRSRLARARQKLPLLLGEENEL